MKLKNYGQESGRAGRDGKQVAGIRKDERGWVDMQEFVRGDVCRRVVLDQVMDGRMSREECEEGKSGVTFVKSEERRRKDRFNEHK